MSSFDIQVSRQVEEPHATNKTPAMCVLLHSAPQLTLTSMLHFLFFMFSTTPGLGMPDLMAQNKYVIGGRDTNITEVPYTAVLFRNSNFICGAIIVSERYLLTAAHCINSQSEYHVRVGSSFREHGGEVYNVKRAVPHPRYLSYDYDIGFLEVDTPMKFSSTVQPIPVADEEPEAGETAKISGYGRISPAELPEQLQSAELIVADRERCNSVIELTPRMMCTLSKNYDKCGFSGDSGGPLVARGKVVGSVSWGVKPEPCHFPTVYANLADPHLRKFIKENTGV